MNLVSEYPWYYILLCLLCGFLYAFILYRSDRVKKTFSNIVLFCLFAFRFLSVLIICFLLLNVFLKHVINETEKPLIIFAQDNSSSIISGKDSAEIKNNFLKKIDELNSTLSGQYKVQYLLFGNKIQANSKADFNDKETDVSQLLNEIDNNYSNQNIGALVIAIDGIINKGTSPLYTAEKFKFPIYTIALGDTTLKKDAFIQKIDHNQVVYFGNKFPVEVSVQAVKLKGKSSTVSIYQGGVKKAEQNINFNSDNFTQTLNFILEAEKPGVQKYTIQLTSLNEEDNSQNNIQSFVVDVIDNREKILIIASAPHPDVAAVKQSIELNQVYEVECFVGNNFSKPLKPYSLIIFHNVLLAGNKLISEINKNGQSYLAINPPPNDILPGIKIMTSYNKYNETEVILNKNFTLFNLSTELKNYIDNFPAVNCYFAKYNVSPGANTLLYQKIGMVETENPLFVFNDFSGQKIGAILGDGIWRWRLRDYADHGNHNLFNELLNKTVQYLSVKADKSFFRLFTKKIINENEPIDFTAEVYNQSYELITDPEVNINLIDESGKQFNYTMSKSNTSYHVEAGMFPPGEYKYKANVKVDQQLFSQSGSITIKAIVAEKVNTVADHNILFQLSQNTGGKLFLPSEISKLEKELMDNERIKPITYSQKQLSDLIDLKWIFFLILGLLSVEWFLRKRSGTI